MHCAVDRTERLCSIEWRLVGGGLGLAEIRQMDRTMTGGPGGRWEAAVTLPLVPIENDGSTDRITVARRVFGSGPRVVEAGGSAIRRFIDENWHDGQLRF